MSSRPYPLPGNRPADRFYRGGEKIAALRGIPWHGGRLPEDWIGSTTTLHGEESLGLTTLPDGRTLRAAVTADPLAWLGEEHVAAFGADTMLLTKLLHAGQRLPVHLHPDGEFAARHLGRRHGKTEAWVILAPGVVHLGFAEQLTATRLRELVDRQDVPALLGSLHSFEVRPGDAVLVPAGMPHAIGEGVLLVEVQEPEDLSILLEWAGFAIDGPREGQLGLGLDLALTATDLRARTAGEIGELVTHRGAGSLLPSAAGRWFRVEASTGAAELEPGFSVLVAIAGDGQLHWADGSVELARGATVLTPHGAGPLRVSGEITVLRCRPPSPVGSPQSSASDR
ncbi:class I mannose-6-phosphate isomerase [Naumannella sp. ID2617S]|nr:class I mannose-6-phosphate isomerase [Naumannella sp. ID2617S]